MFLSLHTVLLIVTPYSNVYFFPLIIFKGQKEKYETSLPERRNKSIALSFRTFASNS